MNMNKSDWRNHHTKLLHKSDWRNHHTNLIGLRSSVGCSQCMDIKTASQLKCSLIIIAHLKQISEEIDVQCMQKPTIDTATLFDVSIYWPSACNT